MGTGHRSRIVIVVGFVLALAAGLITVASAHPEGPAHHAPTPPHATEVMRAFAADQQTAAVGDPVVGGAVACENGTAAGYPCSNVDLLSHLPLSHIGGTQSNSKANDIWGWTDPSNGREYAIVGRVFGTSFVDITDPSNPVYLGDLPTHGSFGSSWRDIKVYADHAYIVSEALSHGMQVFDLTQLRNVTSAPVTFSETAHYNKVASAHNLAINEVTGFAYVVGASGKNSCSGGLHMVDIRTPASPSFAGCFSADGYTHDTQCVVYSGPDTEHQGKEICLNSNEDTITIVDVSNKSNPVMLARVGYDGSGYTHQGWLTGDQTHFLLDDELDEQDFGHGTRTRVWNVSDLDNPTLASTFTNATAAIDHNQYVKGNHTYQANYRAGLRILEISDTTVPSLSEIGFFDIYPADDAAEFNGAWSNYPYFASGVVIVSGIEQGLFVLRPNIGSGGGGTTSDVTITSPAAGEVSGVENLAATTTSDVTAVEFFVDATSLGFATEATEDTWTSTWDTTTSLDGTYTLKAVATTPDGAVEDSITVTVNNDPDPTVHVGDLDGTTSVHPRNGRWDATVTVTVHDGSHAVVSGVTVAGTWSGGATSSCSTGVDGTCSVTLTGIHKNTSSVTFTVDGLTLTGYVYVQADNHDETDGDTSDGSSISVAKG